MNIFKKKFDVTKEGFTDLVSAGSKIEGDIFFDKVIKVCGSVTGNVIKPLDTQDAKSEYGVLVDADADIKVGEIRADSIVIAGSCGEASLSKPLTIWAEHNLTIESSAVIWNAVIYFRELKIEPGARLVNCMMKHLDYVSEGEVI